MRRLAGAGRGNRFLRKHHHILESEDNEPTKRSHNKRPENRVAIKLDPHDAINKKGIISFLIPLSFGRRSDNTVLCIQGRHDLRPFADRRAWRNIPDAVRGPWLKGRHRGADQVVVGSGRDGTLGTRQQLHMQITRIFYTVESNLEELLCPGNGKSMGLSFTLWPIENPHSILIQRT